MTTPFRDNDVSDALLGQHDAEAALTTTSKSQRSRRSAYLKVFFAIVVVVAVSLFLLSPGQRSLPINSNLAQPTSVALEDKPVESSAPPDAQLAPATNGIDNATIQANEAAAAKLSAPERKLHFLLPATRGGDHLCKVIYSAAANGYPSPVLINWEMEAEKGQGEVSHLAKVTGVMNYLKSLGKEAEDDLVIMTDAFDLWFQLPKDVLLAKYEQVLAESNARAAEDLGPGALDHGLWNSVVFGADKGCYGFFPDEPQCWLQPESPLPLDLYGDNTDRLNHGWNLRSSFRPRWLNSGFIIGPVSDYLGMFERTQEYIEQEMRRYKTEQHGKTMPQSDQRIFQMVYSEQQFNRALLSLDNPSWSKNGPERINRTSPGTSPKAAMNLDTHPEFLEMELVPETNYEFGMTVDFNSTIGFNTNGADHEYAFLLYRGGPGSPWPRVVKNDPRDCKIHLEPSLPDVIQNGILPETIKEAVSFETWGDYPLLTNLCTGEVPAIVHHNGDKSQRERKWSTMWYTRHWVHIVAGWQDDDDTQTEINKGSAYKVNGEKLTWNNICRLWEDKLFVRDPLDYPPILDSID